MKKIIATVVITLAIIVLSTLIYIYSGAYDIGQLSEHNGIGEWAVKTTMKRSVHKRSADIELPSGLYDSSNLITGFNHYNEMCISCHGAPGREPGEMVEGLYPGPPLLHNMLEVESGGQQKKNGDMEAAEFFWIIRNGIRMTAMPAFGPTHSDEKIWAITAFVLHTLPDLPAQEYSSWLQKYGEEMEEGEGGHESEGDHEH